MPRRNGSGIELLADPMRRRLLAAVALRPSRPSTLALAVGLSRPATSRQLHLLRDAGLVKSSRSMADRRAVLFTMDSRSHGQITAWLAGTEVGRPTVKSSDQPQANGPAVHDDGEAEEPQLFDPCAPAYLPPPPPLPAPLPSRRPTGAASRGDDRVA